ncbi:MAG TPA: Na+/H+ antiporter [Verrucomicrobiae bacterium]|nr:Na+/H+ antiporter [Verrucomicrobiae bacterium]
MSAPYHLEIIVLLLVAVLILMTLARRVMIPYPILLVLGGLALSLVPNVPVVRLDPDLVFLVFLPPVLWAAAYFTSLRDFAGNLRPIVLLAVGLVVVTTGAVAVAARLIIPGMSWPVAFALGAIVSPPDAVAATAIARRLRIPHRLVTILEGESLINDAAALVLYRVSVVIAVSGGTITVGAGLLEFAMAALGGVLVGLVVGLATRWALRFTDDSLGQIAITLLAPYAAWVIGERTHVSAVLACVVGGLYVRQAFSSVVPPVTRIQARAVWDLLLFILNGLIFILIGLQLGAIRASGMIDDLGVLLLQGAVVSVAAIVVRLVWVPLATLVPRWASRSLRRRDPIPPAGHVFLVAWTGMRGIVSLAAALALPLDFPHRDEVILLTFSVILSTLVVQGLSLTPLIRWLHLGHDDSLELEEAFAREAAARAALGQLEAVDERATAREEVERLRASYTQRVERSTPISLGEGSDAARARAARRRLRHDLLTAERRALIDLRDRGVISDEVLHRLEQELDVEAIRLGLGETRLDGGPGPPSSVA